MWYMVPQNEAMELWPRARSHLHSAGPCPFHASFTATRTCVEILPSWEPMWQYLVEITNIKVGITFIIHKLTDGVDYMSKEFNGLSDWVLSHWFPIGKNSYTCGPDVWAMKELWEGRSPAKWRCDLAHGKVVGWYGGPMYSSNESTNMYFR
jgi:hypothetical protein